MESLKPTPRVVLGLGGYNDMTRELRVMGGDDNPVPEDTTILMKIPVLKSGSRDISLPQSFEALKTGSTSGSR